MVSLWGLVLVIGALKNENKGLLIVSIVAKFEHYVIVGQNFENVGTLVIYFSADARIWQCAIGAQGLQGAGTDV